MQKSGIVMTIQKTHAVVLTADGQFCRIPTSPKMEIGMEISFVPAAAPEKNRFAPWTAKRPARSRHWQRYGVAGLAASLVVAVGVWFASNSLYPAQADAYAFVSVDINPSMLFQVDKNMRVVSFQGQNSDGQTLLSTLHLKGLSLSNAMEQVVSQAAEMNMLPTEDSILVATAPVETSVSVAQIESAVKQDVKDAINASPTAESLHPSVYSIPLSNVFWQAANQAKVPPAKLAAFLIARSEGQDWTVAQLSGGVLKQVFANPSPTALYALSSDNVTVVEHFIQTMQKTGLLSSAISNAHLASTFPGNTVQPPAQNQILSKPENKSGNIPVQSNQGNHSGSDKTAKNANPSSVTVQVGNTKFSVPLGNQNGSHKEVKKSEGLSTTGQSQDGHSNHTQGWPGRGSEQWTNQVVGQMENAFNHVSAPSGVSPAGFGDFSSLTDKDHDSHSKSRETSIPSELNKITHDLFGALGSERSH